jgi:electron transfer flavoprotein beta subunit
MKILIPIKRVPDPYGRIRLTPDGHIDKSDIKWVINPFDEIAIEEAVRLRESGLDVEIVAVTVGSADCEDQMRTALAMGADRAIHVLDDGELEPGVVSTILAAVYKRENPAFVLMGKQAIDDDYNQTGQMLAAKLGIPQATFASKLELSPDGTRAKVSREVDAGRETLEVTLPAVITTDLRLNEPRYVALPAIIRARSKPSERIESSDLGPRPTARIKTIKLETPAPRKAGRKVESVDELITALREEARVI